MEQTPDERPSERTVTIGDHTFMLKRENTRLRLYRPSTFNHIDFQVSEERTVAFAVSEATMQDLIAHGYPRIEMDIRDDPGNQEWFVNYALGDFACRDTITVDDFASRPR